VCRSEVGSSGPSSRAFKQLYYHLSCIIIDAYLSGDETVFDKHIERFGTIGEIAQEILSMDAEVDL
jgi:hypothetical protein